MENIEKYWGIAALILLRIAESIKAVDPKGKNILQLILAVVKEFVKFG